MDIHEMKLHDLSRIPVQSIPEGKEIYVEVLRVPGGWIYLGSHSGSIFVPYSTEFKEVVKPKPTLPCVELRTQS